MTIAPHDEGSPSPEQALGREAADRFLHGLEALCRLQGFAVKTWVEEREDDLAGRFWVEHLVLTHFQGDGLGYALSRGYLNDGPLEQAVVLRREAVETIARHIAQEAAA